MKKYKINWNYGDNEPYPLHTSYTYAYDEDDAVKRFIESIFFPDRNGLNIVSVEECSEERVSTHNQ